MARAKKRHDTAPLNRHDTAPLKRLIKSYVHDNGGRKKVKDLTTINSESTYGARNREPDKYQLGELISVMTAYKIPKIDFLMAILSVFDIPAEVVNAAVALMQLEEKK